MTPSADAPMMVDLPRALGARLERMPWVHRILVENLLRHRAVDADADRAATAWLEHGDMVELPFVPARLLMHDTTCGPALVDLAAMRSVIAAEGGDPRRITPGLRVDVSTDHSIAVDRHGTRDALAANLASEMARNAERFGLMKWAGSAFPSLYVHPPGTGIMHTINLERLATLVIRAPWQGREWLFPDTLIGTDSHTPMVNGIGVLGWGVGGLEAESVMLGMPVTLRVPEIVGVRLDGRLRPGVTATDLALAVTERLRAIRLDGRFVEFFGSGVSTLSAGTRAVVANMAPEFGGATGYFPPDAEVVAYLRATGRKEADVAQAEAYLRRQSLWFDPNATPDYHRVLTIDLDGVVPSVAGPHRPQDRIARADLPATVGGSRPVAIAAITSCTNTSDPRLLVAAGLLARTAVARGLSVPAWVKTSLAPGSPTAAAVLERAGLLAPLEALGFAIVAYGCTTCIGNSGPLSAEMDARIANGAQPVAVLSGNRNFPGRVHQSVRDSYLASPPLVVAYALAGDFNRSIETDPIGIAQDGTPVFLRDIWPAEAEIDAALSGAVDPRDFDTAYAAAEANPAWAKLVASSDALYPWEDASTYLRPPPFVRLDAPSRLGSYTAWPLLVLGDDITTDHISPAGAIAAGGEAGRWLTARGERANDLNVFSARRGNWEVMVRGMFTNASVRNLIAADVPPGSTIHVPSGEILPLWQAAERYAADDEPVVVVAGDRYGMGSSRDWAAKGQYLLGVRAVLAVGFERIHRSNLCNMGILPLELPADVNPAALALGVGDRIAVHMPGEALAPAAPCAVRVHYADGREFAFSARAAVETLAEVQVVRAGGLLPLILRAALTAS